MEKYFVKNNLNDFMVSDSEFLFYSGLRRKIFITSDDRQGLLRRLISYLVKNQRIKEKSR